MIDKESLPEQVTVNVDGPNGLNMCLFLVSTVESMT